MQNIDEILESVKALPDGEKITVLNGIIALLWGSQEQEPVLLKSVDERPDATVTELSSFRPATRPVDLEQYRKSKP